LYNAAGTLTSFIGGGTGGAYINSGNVGIGTVSPNAKLHVAGNIIASSPTADNHVATKGYVDTQVSQRGCYVSYLGSSGSCLSGFTNMGSAGAWGSCKHPTTGNYDSYFLPAGGSCTSGYTFTQLGTASVCCK